MAESNELSEREIEILKLVATGLSNKEIAAKLSISPNTVKVHLKNIFAKIGVMSRTEAAMYAVKMGWAGAGSQIVDETDDRVPSNAQTVLSPLLFGLLGLGFIAIVFFVIRLVNPTNNNQPKIVQVVVTPTPEPVKWELVTHMPEAKKSMAYAAVDNKIYIIGGETPNGVSGKVDIYDINTNQWNNGKDMLVPVYDACSSVIGGKLYIVGGKDKENKILNDMSVYDIELDQWSKQTPLIIPISGCSAFNYDGKLYVAGGENLDGSQKIIYQFDPENQIWTDIGQMNLPRSNFASTLITSQLYILGGSNNYGYIADIDVYRLANKIQFVEKLRNIQEKRTRFAALNVLNKIYIIGGKNDMESLVESLEINPIDNQMRLIPNPIDEEWYALGAVNQGEYIYGFGGMINGKIVDDVYRVKILYTIVLPVINN